MIFTLGIMNRMRIRFILLIAAVLFIGFTHRGARAESYQDEIRELKEQLSRQAGMIEELKAQFRKVDLGVQYRIMYNAANLPTYKGSFENPDDYDFFRQRFRISLDVSPSETAGGFAQLEFRNAWGVGSGKEGPAVPADVTYNRLTARGLRYGYIYLIPGEGQRIMAGILPQGDWVNDTLFSAAWGFSVGGIAYLGESGRYKYRAQITRLVDTLDSTLEKDVDGHLYSLDGLASIGKFDLGGHFYFLDKEENRQLAGFLAQDVREMWYALSISAKVARSDINGFVMLNNGELDGDSHKGWALRGEAGVPLGSTRFSLLSIYTSGDDDERQQSGRLRRAFFTPMQLLDTEGFWQYTHIFSANLPSDVNDLGIDIGNGGFGLLTLQAKLDFPIVEKLKGRVETGWFKSMGKSSSKDREMGWEAGGMLILNAAEHLNLELGAAYASMGDWFHPDAEDLYMVFSRFQLAF